MPHPDHHSLPDGSNCSGHIWSDNLGRVCEAALTSGPWTVTRCDRSGYDGRWRLRLQVAGLLDLESDGPLADGSYLLDGAVAVQLERGKQLLKELSTSLARAGVPHRLELYGTAGDILLRFDHGWRDNTDRPEVPLWR